MDFAKGEIFKVKLRQADTEHRRLQGLEPLMDFTNGEIS
jgi:hypothetical protein